MSTKCLEYNRLSGKLTFYLSTCFNIRCGLDCQICHV